jgi:hypothetical protein
VLLTALPKRAKRKSDKPVLLPHVTDHKCALYRQAWTCTLLAKVPLTKYTGLPSNDKMSWYYGGGAYAGRSRTRWPLKVLCRVLGGSSLRDHCQRLDEKLPGRQAPSGLPTSLTSPSRLTLTPRRAATLWPRSRGVGQVQSSHAFLMGSPAAVVDLEWLDSFLSPV